jgi:hypothetical protein
MDKKERKLSSLKIFLFLYFDKNFTEIESALIKGYQLPLNLLVLDLELSRNELFKILSLVGGRREYEKTKLWANRLFFSTSQ